MFNIDLADTMGLFPKFKAGGGEPKPKEYYKSEIIVRNPKIAEHINKMFSLFKLSTVTKKEREPESIRTVKLVYRLNNKDGKPLTSHQARQMRESVREKLA